MRPRDGGKVKVSTTTLIVELGGSMNEFENKFVLTRKSKRVAEK